MSLRVNPDRPPVRRGSWGPLYPFPYSGLLRAWTLPTPPRYSWRQVGWICCAEEVGAGGGGQREDTAQIRPGSVAPQRAWRWVGGWGT